MAHQQNLEEVNAIWGGGPGGTVGGGTDWGGIASSLKGFGSLLNLGAGIAGIITGVPSRPRGCARTPKRRLPQPGTTRRWH